MKKKNKQRLLRRIVNFIKRWCQHRDFRIKNPGVKIVQPKDLPKAFAQDGQDLIVLSYLLKDLSNFEEGMIVDVGCNDPIRFSNSYLFEMLLNFKTLAIDPQVKYKSRWNKERPNSIFIPCAVGAKTEELVLNISNCDDMFSGVRKDDLKIEIGGYEQKKVRCDTLGNIFKLNGIKKIELLSVDVEGYELEVIKGIDFGAVIIKVIIIENNTKNIYGDDEIRQYLKRNGYKFELRIGYLDDLFIRI